MRRGANEAFAPTSRPSSSRRRPRRLEIVKTVANKTHATIARARATHLDPRSPRARAAHVVRSRRRARRASPASRRRRGGNIREANFSTGRLDARDRSRAVVARARSRRRRLYRRARRRSRAALERVARARVAIGVEL